MSNKMIKKSERFKDWSNVNTKNICLPKLKVIEKGFCPSLKRTFANLHNFHINSISVSPNGENFISADDLWVNFWNLENINSSFNVLDIKP